MGLLGTTTAEQYYNRSQKFTTTANQADATHADYGKFTLTVSLLPNSEDDFILFVDGTEVNQSTYTYNNSSGEIVITSAQPAVGKVVLAEFIDRSLGDYRYITLKDFVNNFVMGYVGNGKLIPHAERTEIIFHAKRGMQEFTYDISRMEKIQEVEIPPSLTIPMPQDYVSYISLSWVDDAGVEHPVFPARYTSRPSESIAQDDNFDYLFDQKGGLLTINPSTTEQRFKDFNVDIHTGTQQNDDYFLYTHYIANRLHTFSSRYGVDPESANYNGVFVIDEVNGQFGFDSSMSGRLLLIKYVSDGLATDGEMKVHKMAEDALYKYVLFNLLSTRSNIPEYIINRYRKERRAAMRNAKLRLSPLKLKEITQVMKGKSKHIKH